MTYDEYDNFEVSMDSIEIWVTANSNLDYLVDLSEKCSDSIDIEFSDPIYNVVLDKSSLLGIYKGYIDSIHKGNSSTEIIFSIICSDEGNQADVMLTVEDLLKISYYNNSASLATLYVPSEICSDVIESMVDNDFRC